MQAEHSRHTSPQRGAQYGAASRLQSMLCWLAGKQGSAPCKTARLPPHLTEQVCPHAVPDLQGAGTASSHTFIQAPARGEAPPQTTCKQQLRQDNAGVLRRHARPRQRLACCCVRALRHTRISSIAPKKSAAATQPGHHVKQTALCRGTPLQSDLVAPQAATAHHRGTAQQVQAGHPPCEPYSCSQSSCTSPAAPAGCSAGAPMCGPDPGLGWDA